MVLSDKLVGGDVLGMLEASVSVSDRSDPNNATATPNSSGYEPNKPTTKLNGTQPRKPKLIIAKKYPGNADAAQDELMRLALEGVRRGEVVVRVSFLLSFALFDFGGSGWW